MSQPESHQTLPRRVRCAMCADHRWIRLEALTAHMELTHPDLISKVARWPDGTLVIYDEDALDELLEERDEPHDG